MQWASLFALAVNEENAAGSNVVTEPTNGAAGIVPAVLHYFQKFYREPTSDDLKKYFLTSYLPASQQTISKEQRVKPRIKERFCKSFFTRAYFLNDF